MNQETIGGRLKLLRQDSGWPKVRDVSTITTIPAESIVRYESGELQIPPHHLFQFSTLYNADALWIMFGDSLPGAEHG